MKEKFFTPFFGLKNITLDSEKISHWNRVFIINYIVKKLKQNLTRFKKSKENS